MTSLFINQKQKILELKTALDILNVLFQSSVEGSLLQFLLISSALPQKSAAN